MNSERIRSDSTMQHKARHKLELMVLHEYKPPKCFPNTSLAIRLSRPLIRTDTSLDRESRAFRCIHYQLSGHRETLHTTASVTSCRDTEGRCIPLHPLPDQPRIQTELSMGLHGSCQVSTFDIHGTPWKLPRFHTRSPWDSMEAARLPHALCPTPVLRDGTPHQRRLIRTDTTLPFTTYQNRPKLCWLEPCREHHETRRDVVSGQTEGNSVSVVKAVHRVDRFSHKIVQVSSVG